MKFLLPFLSALVLYVSYIEAQSIISALQHQDAPPCGMSMICRWAVCQWRRNIHPNTEECTFVNFDCSCPEGTVCRQTSTTKPRPNNIITFYYKCRHP